MESTCDKCNDTGTLRHEIGPIMPPVDMGNGVTLESMGGLMSSLCECRKSLPPRHGKAAWWNTEDRLSETYKTIVSDEIHATVNLEVPISIDNYRVHRTRDNAYYPAAITLDLPADNVTFHTVEDLRGFAAFLIKIADQAEKIEEFVPEEPQ